MLTGTWTSSGRRGSGRRADDEGHPARLPGVGAAGELQHGQVVAAHPALAHGDRVGHRPVGLDLPRDRVHRRGRGRLDDAGAVQAAGHRQADHEAGSRAPVPAEPVDLDAVPHAGRRHRHVQVHRAAGGHALLHGVAVDARHQARVRLRAASGTARPARASRGCPAGRSRSGWPWRRARHRGEGQQQAAGEGREDRRAPPWAARMCQVRHLGPMKRRIGDRVSPQHG